MAIEDKIIRIALRKIKFIDQAEADLLDGLEPTEQKIFQAIKRQLSKMNQDGGKISFDETNVNLMNQLDQILIQEIQKSGYPNAVRKYLRDFDTITDFNGELHSQLNGIDPEELKKIVGPGQEQIVEDTLQGLTGSGVSNDVVAPIRQELFKNVVAGSSFDDVENALRDFILGEEGKAGHLEKYVTQITRDALNQYDGQVNAQIANEFGLDAFEYVGSLIEDSRPQCRRWVNKEVLLKDELPNEIAWANGNGSGMIPGTTPDNFAVYRGGYNCRHAAIPFKLTKREAERLKARQAKEPTEEDDVNAEIKRISTLLNINEDQAKIIQQKLSSAKTGTTLEDKLFRSTQNEEINKNFLDSLKNNDGANEIANEFQTNVSLRQRKESTGSGAKKFLEQTGKGGDISTIGQIGNEQGHVSTDNKRFNIIYKKGDLIEHRKVKVFGKNPFEIKEEDLSEYIDSLDKQKLLFRTETADEIRFYKKKQSTSSSGILEFEINKKTKKVTFFSIDQAENIFSETNNINGIIVHESGHLIQNKHDATKLIFDVKRTKMIELMKKRGIKISDAPTIYGRTNASEFFAETWTSYVLTHEDLKISNRKLFDFFEELLFDIYGIDKKSIIFPK